MSSLPTKLKDPRTCRIFFSSPFGGMEEEREELTRKYFPQIHYLCNSRGIQFVAVDMRWGITSEAAENAQTVSICLRELDRSDMFVGFFGQRYGWFGKNDEALQKNIEKAILRYPWLDGHRGKSVTEMEFLHGHLNTPGSMPAIICFRDKSYDDMKRTEGETLGNKKQVFKFSAESSESVQLMDDLKQRVEETRDKTLGVQMSYSNPAQAAEFMFTGVWEHLNKVLLADLSSSQSPREKSKAHHDAFAASRSNLYVGGEKYFQYLKENVIDAEDSPRIMVCGPAGSGKSALLSSWIPKLRQEERGLIVAYHFIGCAPGSDSPLEILEHLKDEVAFGLSGEENSSTTEKSGGKSVQEMMQLLQQTLEQASSQTRNVLIIIDGLGKVKLSARAQKPLYWLPLISSKRVKVVVSIKDTDTKSLEVLEESGYKKMQIEPLSEPHRREICKRTLAVSGKELSHSQMDRVVSAEHSQNALFLKIAISELSVFGYFRQLDEKIDSLIKCDGVGELFQEYLSRLERDYNVQDYKGNLVQQVMMALMVSHEGLSENELMEILHIPNHVWSPLYFAMETYILDRSGVLGFAFEELRDAVSSRYMKSQEDRITATKPVIDYFNAKRKNFHNFTDMMAEDTRRTTNELPWLHKDIEDWEGLAMALSDLYIFSRLHREREYDLLELWKDTKLSFNTVASMYMDSMDRYIADRYLLIQEHLEEEAPPGLLLLEVLTGISNFLNLASCVKGRENIIRRRLNILENVKGKKGMSPDKNVAETLDTQLSLANLLVDMGRYEEGIQLHTSVRDRCQRMLDEEGQQETLEVLLATSLCGIGMAYLLQGMTEKAFEAYNESLELYRKWNEESSVLTCMQNLGYLTMNQEKYEEAIKIFEDCMKGLEKIHFGSTYHELGNLMTNIALCYRRLNRLDEAEKMYSRSLEMKAAAVGWEHINVAMAYGNLSALELYREKPDYQKALEYSDKTIRIYELNEVSEDDFNYRKLLENHAISLYQLERHDEAVTLYLHVLDILVRNKVVHQRLKKGSKDIVQYLFNNQKYAEAERILLVLLEHDPDPVSYFILDFLDILQPREEPRPQHLTLDHALTIWPGDATLCQQKAVKHLIPGGATEELLQLLPTMINADYNTAVYNAAAKWCTDAGRDDMAVEVLEAGHKAYPDHIAYETQLIDLLNKLKRYPEVLVHSKNVLEVEKDNAALFLVSGYAYLMCGDIETAKQTLTKVLHMNDERLAAMAEDLLNKLSNLMAESSDAQEASNENVE